MLYKTLGIVLRYFNFSEADKIVTLYTSRFGKIKAVVKGVRKTKSRFGSSMELFTNSNLLLHHKENRDLYLVTQSSIVDSFKELKNNLNKLYKASYIVEVIDTLVKGSEKNQVLFNLIISAFSMLRHTDRESDSEAILRLFEIKFLTVLGYKLKLDRCSLCNKEFNNDKYFVSDTRFGILCKNCSADYYKKTSYPITKNSMDFMKSMQNEEMKDYLKLKLSNQNLAELKKVLPNFIRYYAEKEMNSFKFI